MEEAEAGKAGLAESDVDDRPVLASTFGEGNRILL